MPMPQVRSNAGSACAQAFVSGVLYGLAQPPFSLWPLAFVCLVPLALALRGRSWRMRVGLGAIAGTTAAWATSLAPAAVGLAHFFERSLAFGIAGGALAGAATGGVAFALAGTLTGAGSSHFALPPWRFAAAFAAGEWLRSNVATGLPWLLIGHALAPAPATAQLAAILGVGGLGFAIAAVNGSIAQLLRGPGRGVAMGSALILLATFSFAAWKAPELVPGDPGSVAAAGAGSAIPAQALRVALIQPATPLSWSGDAARVRDRLARLAALSREALPAALLIWPESAVEAPLPANEPLIRGAVADLDPPPALLFGAPRYERAAPTRLYNSAILWDASGNVRGAHDKIRLLPFTEFVPGWLAALGARGGHTAAGTRLAPLVLDDTGIGVLICYELLFPALARELVDAGAGILVNPSNDDWFGATAGGEQMLAAAVLRAIEARRPLLRATPSGVTAAIDAHGRLVARLPVGTPGVLLVDVVPVR